MPLLAFWVFQFAFADTCSTITSGAMVGRSGFVGDILYSIGVTGFIYPIIGHWAWGPDGWLGACMAVPFHDFAGSTVVHTIGGAISLAGRDRPRPAARPRVQARRRRPDAAAQHHPRRRRRPDPLVRLVRLQPGQHAVGAGHRRASAASSFNTTLAACSAGLAALFYAYCRSEKWDLGLTVNGFLAGLVAITCPCYWVSPTGAFFIGIVAGVVVIWAIDVLEYLRIDDPIGAVPVHMVCGIWGTLSLGLFATGEYGAADADRRRRRRSP